MRLCNNIKHSVDLVNKNIKKVFFYGNISLEKHPCLSGLIIT